MATADTTTPARQHVGYLKQQAAAAFLGVTVRTLARWEQAGIVRGHRVRRGGAKLYSVEGLRKAAAGVER